MKEIIAVMTSGFERIDYAVELCRSLLIQSLWAFDATLTGADLRAHVEVKSQVGIGESSIFEVQDGFSCECLGYVSGRSC